MHPLLPTPSFTAPFLETIWSMNELPSPSGPIVTVILGCIWSVHAVLFSERTVYFSSGTGFLLAEQIRFWPSLILWSSRQLNNLSFISPAIIIESISTSTALKLFCLNWTQTLRINVQSCNGCQAAKGYSCHFFQRPACSSRPVRQNVWVLVLSCKTDWSGDNLLGFCWYFCWRSFFQTFEWQDVTETHQLHLLPQDWKRLAVADYFSVFPAFRALLQPGSLVEQHCLWKKTALLLFS